MTRILCSLFFGLMLAHSLVVASVTAQSLTVYPFLPLTPNQPQLQLTDYLYFYEDSTGQLEANQLFVKMATTKFQKFQGQNIDFGFRNSTFWLLLPIENTSQNRAGRWLLDLNTRFMNTLSVDLITEKSTQRILSDSETAPFTARKLAHRHIVGEFELLPQQKAVLLIGYFSRGTTALPLSIETETSFYLGWITSNNWNVAFYAAMSILVLFNLFQFTILRSMVHLSYAIFVIAALLYVFHMDGFSFQYLWPNLPKWNAIASLYLGLTSGICAVLFTRIFLQTAKFHPTIDRLLLLLVGIAIIEMTAALFFGENYLKQLAFWVTTTGACASMVAGVFAYCNGMRAARFYIIGWLAVFSTTLIASVAHSVPGLYAIPNSFNLTKIGVLFDALMFAMALADQTNEMRIQRDAAHERERALLDRDLQAQKRMVLLQQQYQKILGIAQEKSMQLASAGHDLRQPLLSLRSALQSMYPAKQGGAISNQFREGFDYIDGIIRQYLDQPEVLQGEAETYDSQPVSEVEPEEGVEIFSIQVVIDSIRQMFSADAKANNLTLKCVSSSLAIRANPIVVMRIVSNLVENAIKYTAGGKVLVGCRRRYDAVELQVLDTGDGFSPEDKARLFSFYQRGEQHANHTGHGLGLAIVKQLVEENDFQVCAESKPGIGTKISISIPKANANPASIV